MSNEELNRKEKVGLKTRIIMIQKEYQDNQEVITLCEGTLKKLEKLQSLQEIKQLRQEFLKQISFYDEERRTLNREKARLHYEITLFLATLNHTISFGKNTALRNLALHLKAELPNIKSLSSLIALKKSYEEKVKQITNTSAREHFSYSKNSLIRDIDQILEDIGDDTLIKPEILKKFHSLRREIIMLQNGPDFDDLQQEFFGLKDALKREKIRVFELESEKAKFQKYLKELELANQGNEEYQNLLNKYQQLLKMATKVSELKNYMKDLMLEIRELNLSLEADKRKRIKAEKMAMRNYFADLCDDYIKKHPKDAIEASEFLANLSFYINAIEPAKFDDLKEKLVDIKFESLDRDLKVYRELDPILYVNKKMNDVVALLRKDEKNAYFYSINKQMAIALPLDEFERMFISLKMFFKKGEYVGDKTVFLKTAPNHKQKVERPFQEFAWCYDKNVMLALSEAHGEDERKMVFYPLSYYKSLFERPYWSIAVEPDKEPREDIRELRDANQAREVVQSYFHQALLKPLKEADEYQSHLSFQK